MTNHYPEIPIAGTVPQIAKLLNCSERTVWKRIATGEIGSVKIGRLVRVPRHRLLEFLSDANESGPAKDGAANTTTPNVQEKAGRHRPS